MSSTRGSPKEDRPGTSGAEAKEPDSPRGRTDEDGEDGSEAADKAVSQARDAALNLLSYRARSVAEMEGRLRKKGFDDPVIAEVVARLLDLGYLNDRDFARQFLDERLRRRPRGPFALIQEMQKRGVDRGLAREVLSELMAERGIDEAELARDTARRWLSRQSGRVARLLEEGGSGDDALKARRRLYSHLERKGFRREVVRSVLDRITGG